MKKIKPLILAAVLSLAMVVPSYATSKDVVPQQIGPVGFWHITENCVNFRQTAGGTVIGQVNYPDSFDKLGVEQTVWVHCHMTSGQNRWKYGYVHKDYTAFGFAV